MAIFSRFSSHKSPDAPSPRRLPRALILTVAVAVATTSGAVAGIAATGGFSDVPPVSVHADAVAWLAETGITKGCNPPDNDRFCPEDPVTRAQLASFLQRLTEVYDLDAQTPAGADGVDGTDGQDGTNGASAYEVALAEGFVGTEAEWLSSLQAPTTNLLTRVEGDPQFVEFTDGTMSPEAALPIACPSGSLALVGGAQLGDLSAGVVGLLTYSDGAPTGWITRVFANSEIDTAGEVTPWVLCVLGSP